MMRWRFWPSAAIISSMLQFFFVWRCKSFERNCIPKLSFFSQFFYHRWRFVAYSYFFCCILLLFCCNSGFKILPWFCTVLTHHETFCSNDARIAQKKREGIQHWSHRWDFTFRWRGREILTRNSPEDAQSCPKQKKLYYFWMHASSTHHKIQALYLFPS